MKDLVIIGAGDFGREIANVVERINAIESQWNLLGFVDDNEEILNTLIDGYKVLGNINWLNNYDKEAYAICSLGTAKNRKKIISKLNNENIKYATLVDPDAKLYKDATIDEGSIICGGSIAAINVSIGKHVIVNLNCTLGHDDIIGDYSVINPGVNISGKVELGSCVDLGTGSRIIQGHRVSENTVIGAGTVVLKDIDESGTYVGVPAKKVK